MKLKNTPICFRIFNPNINVKLVEINNRLISGCLKFKNYIDYDLVQLSSLKQLYVDKIALELFTILPFLMNIWHLHIESLENRIQKGDRDECFNRVDDDKMGYHERLINQNSNLSFEFIKGITIKYLDSYIDEFINFLSLSPSLEVIKIESFNLNRVKPNIIYKLTTPLLLIASIP